MKIGVNEEGYLELEEVYNPVCIKTDMGVFGVACRDDGIEVVFKGVIVFSSHSIESGPVEDHGRWPLAPAPTLEGAWP